MSTAQQYDRVVYAEQHFCFQSVILGTLSFLKMIIRAVKIDALRHRRCTCNLYTLLEGFGQIRTVSKSTH